MSTPVEEQSYREQIFRADAVIFVVGIALFATGSVLEPSMALAAGFGIACVFVFGLAVADLDGLPTERFGLLWLGLGLAAAIVYLSPTAAALRSTGLLMLPVAVGSALFWIVPAKAAEFGERLGDRFRGA